MRYVRHDMGLVVKNRLYLGKGHTMLLTFRQIAIIPVKARYGLHIHTSI